MIGEIPPVPTFPLSLFPWAQARICALMEQADVAILAGHRARADWLVSRAREEAAALRATIGGLA